MLLPKIIVIRANNNIIYLLISIFQFCFESKNFMSHELWVTTGLTSEKENRIQYMVLSKENAVNNTRKTSCILVTDGHDKKLNPNNHFSSTHQKKFDFSLHESCLKKLGKNCPFSFILVRKNRLKNLAMEIYYNAKNCRVSIEIEFLNSN